jgi:uncharacterized protein
MRMAACVGLLMLALVAQAAAPDFEFHAPASAADPKTAVVMRDLAVRLLPVYQEPDPDRYLAELSVVQMVAGEYGAASTSRQSLRDRRRRADLGRPVDRAAIYDLYANAKMLELQRQLPFAEAFADAFHEMAVHLSDQDAYAVTELVRVAPDVYREALQKALDQQRSMDTISQAGAVELLRAYLSFEAYRNFSSLAARLSTEDDAQRYSVENDILIKSSGGVSIAAVVVRPKHPASPLPALLEFTIYDALTYAKECAAHGYVGVVAYTRGVHNPSQKVVPYQYDGEDARAVIDWIAKQPWSDGRVGMYGEGYSGFTAWAAAAHLPRALKAIATASPWAPGIDTPMAGNIFQSSAYRWSLQLTDPKSAQEDDAAWLALNQKWYLSGKRFRDIGRLNRRPNPVFIRWLNHPSYDGFWQKMVPFQEQFAHINIPVLTTSGYYSASEPGALYYFTQHHHYNAHADHTLLIGPYDEGATQYGVTPSLHGYGLDAAALIDLHALRYEWFDHVFKAAATPALLKDRINYEVMGANLWRHAPSIESMSGAALKFYLAAAVTGNNQRLARNKSPKPGFIAQTVSLRDRKDGGWLPPNDLTTRTIVPHNGVQFVSEPFAKSTELSGLFSGHLDFTVNKMDMDLNVMLYERLSSGEYLRLFDPNLELRLSYVSDRVHRSLLKAGERQQLTITSERMTSRKIQAGSRLVMVLSVSKRPDREINYGTGNDVSEESIAEGKVPLKIQWHSDSYIEIPVSSRR